MMRPSRQMFFEWLGNCVQETIEPGALQLEQVALTKILIKRS